jgi:Flp pilus assembly protein TadG
MDAETNATRHCHTGAVVAGSRSAAGGRERQKTRGQSLVEFALVLPILVLILAISADFGRAFSAYIAVGGAAREGAAFGMMSTANSANQTGIRNAALADAPTIWGVAPSVTSSTGTDANNYQFVQVRVTYTFSPIMRIPPIPNSINMSRTVRMRVLN